MAIVNLRENMEQPVGEGESALITFRLVDEKKVPIPLIALATLTLKLTDEATGQVINGKDGTVSIKNANGGTVDAVSGTASLTLSPADNVIVTPAKRSEYHVAFIVGAYNSGAGVVEKLVAFRVVNV